MSTSRRNFLKSGTMGLLCAGIPVALAKVVFGAPAAASGLPEGNAKTLFLTKGTFTPHLNTIFRIQTGLGPFDLKLTKITDLKAISKIPARIAGKESFSLLFVGSSNAKDLTQDTYIFEHGALGRFSLFLVPVGKSTNRQHEAIIVRL